MTIIILQIANKMDVFWIMLIFTFYKLISTISSTSVGKEETVRLICSKMVIPDISDPNGLSYKNSSHRIYLKEKVYVPYKPVTVYVQINQPVKAIVLQAHHANTTKQACGYWIRKTKDTAIITCNNNNQSLVVMHLGMGDNTVMRQRTGLVHFQWYTTEDIGAVYFVATTINQGGTSWEHVMSKDAIVPFQDIPIYAKSIISKDLSGQDTPYHVRHRRNAHDENNETILTTTAEDSLESTQNPEESEDNSTERMFYLLTILASYVGMYMVFSFLLV